MEKSPHAERQIKVGEGDGDLFFIQTRTGCLYIFRIGVYMSQCLLSIRPILALFLCLVVGICSYVLRISQQYGSELPILVDSRKKGPLFSVRQIFGLLDLPSAWLWGKMIPHTILPKSWLVSSR